MSPSRTLTECEQMTVEPTPRKPACERCRGQKLRCERLPGNENSDALPTCKRCQRAGAVCCTNEPQKSSVNVAQQANTFAPAGITDFSFNDDLLQAPPSKRRLTVDASVQMLDDGAIDFERSCEADFLDVAQLIGNQDCMDLQDHNTLDQNMFDQSMLFDQLPRQDQRSFSISSSTESQEPSSMMSSVSSAAASTPVSDYWRQLGSMVDFGAWSPSKQTPRPFTAPSRDFTPLSRSRSASIPLLQRKDDGSLQQSLNALIELSNAAHTNIAMARKDNVMDETQPVWIERNIKDSNTFIDILKQVTQALNDTNTSTGSDVYSTLIALQVVSLFVSYNELHRMVVEYVKSTLSSRLGMNWCRKMCGGQTNHLAPAVMDDDHLWVRVFIETSVRLVDVMHRRLEALSESSNLSSTASSLLCLLLGKRYCEDGVPEVIFTTRHALKQSYRDAIKLMEDNS